MILAPFFGDLNQIEKPFEIEQPLTLFLGDRGQQQQQRGDQQGGQRSNGNPRGQDTRGPRPDRTPNQPQQQNGQGI